MKIPCNIIVFLVCLPLFGQMAAAQNDDATTRSLAIQGAAIGKQLIINQVDTSAFPKVSIFATVLDSGKPVTGLASADFRVREDEVDQEPVTVVPKLSALSLVVTLDTSGSMFKALPQVKEAAKSFLDTLASEDQAMTVGFARSVTTLSPFSSDKIAARAAIDATVARGDTALYDALYASVQALRGRAGRKAVVLLSDGVDDDGSGKQLSQHSLSDVLTLAKEVNVPIFTIGLGSGIDKSVLERGAKETGAIFFTAAQAEDLKILYSGIGQQLSGQYNILYSSNLPGDGSSHRVQLEIGGLKGNKDYTSPQLTGSVAVLKAPPPAALVQSVAVLAAGGPIEIQGGIDFASAINVQTNQVFKTTSLTRDKPQFFKVHANVGERIYFSAQRLSEAGALQSQYFDSGRAPIIQTQNAYRRWDMASAAWSISKESDGHFYFTLEDGGPVAFGIFSRSVGDLGTLDDAGGEEGSAQSVQLNTDYIGTASDFGDAEDFYKILLPQGKYKVRIRPAADCEIGLALFDDNGVEKGHSRSENKGAGISQTVEVKDKSTFLLKVSAQADLACPYAFTVGGEDIAAPTQPAMLKPIGLPSLQSAQ